MVEEIQIRLDPETAANEQASKLAIARQVGVAEQDITGIRPIKRSIDARNRKVRILLRAQVFIKEEAPQATAFKFEGRDVSKAPEVLVVGAGPAGLFAALKLIEQGVRPILLERGKDVRARRRDLVAITRHHEVNPDSNYCFGEGGAGTYSDGKLYTRSTKRGDVNRILGLLVAHGADPDILVDAHPHIGTNKLPEIITAIREQILACGGIIRFETKVTGLQISAGKLNGAVLADGEKLSGKAVILATGHSARDIFTMLHEADVALEAKSFALGVRAEHQQSIIDQSQYHRSDRGPYLPPASYSLVHQASGLGVYSFCMCPGGIIAPCATAPGEVVTNGWSPSKRNNRFANSGIVVSVDPAKLSSYAQHGPLAGMHFQADVEKTAWMAGGKTQAAPAQRLADFVEQKTSSNLPDCSYQPGIVSQPLKEVLPAFIHSRLREGFKAFGKKMKGYLTNEAVLVGVESRTSSPVRIPRDRETLQHPELEGLFPCGEGAGYAGGIISAAIDGERCAIQAAVLANK